MFSFFTATIFQFTSPRGNEHPVWLVICSWAVYFNSRLRKETNDPLTVLAPPFYLFQLTSQRGDEHKSWYTWIRGIYISIHVSLGRRTDSYCLEYCAREFQLTSPQGDEHKSLVAVLINQLNFNSHLLAETNLTENERFSSAKLFQFTSPYGDEHNIYYIFYNYI